MASLSRLNLQSQMRFDLQHGLAMESFAAFDVRALNTLFSGSDKSYVVRGLEAVGKSGLTLTFRIADCLVFNPADEVGSFYYGLSTEADIQIDLPADQPVVYIEARFKSETGSPTNAAYWNPLALVGAEASGSEYTSLSDFEEFIALDITSNTVGFSPGAMPLAVTTTSASAITDLSDRRESFLRLAQGGASPNQLYKYPFATSRQEPTLNGPGVGDAVDSSWRSSDGTGALNDKAFKSLKDWMNAVMTRISEVAGSPIWYLSGSSVAPVTDISLNQTYFDTLGHNIQPSSNAAFKWKTQSGGLRLTSEGIVAGSSPYADGLIRWKANYSGLEWQLGGTFVSASDRSYSALRFQSPIPVDGGNVYIRLEREVSKGSGAPVTWASNTSYSGFIASKAVSGSTGDFIGVALGDYVRKESEGYSRYYRVNKISDGTLAGTFTYVSSPNKVADSTIVALELENITDPSTGIASGTSTESLVYFRSRYSDADVFADTVASTFLYQSADYYWLGRRQSSLFFLRDYGTMQEGEEVTTLDSTWAKGRQGGGSDLMLQHALNAEYDASTGYGLSTGSGTLLTIRRFKRNNTVDTPSSGDNSGALLEYTITAPVGTMTDGDTLWVKLNDSTGGALASGSVTNTTDDLNNTNTVTNTWEIRPATTTPPRTFDDKDVYLVGRKFTLSGAAYVLFLDGSMLTEDGQYINGTLVVQSDLFLRNKTTNSIPYIGATGKVLEDNANLFYNPSLNGGTAGLANFRFYYDSGTGIDHLEQGTERDIQLFGGSAVKELRIGNSNTDIHIPGNLYVEGTTHSFAVSNISVEDKLITLGVGLLVDTAQGAGIEIADNTQQATSQVTVSASDLLTINYGAPHGYSTGSIIGYDTNTNVGGLTAGAISGEYTFVVSSPIAGQAVVTSSTQIQLKLGSAASASETVNFSNPTTYGRTFVKPWSIRVSDAAGAYAGRTSWAFQVKGVATVPTLTPVSGYGIVPTALSSMAATRVPFAANDNSGPAGADTTLDFSSQFYWDNSTNTLFATNLSSAAGLYTRVTPPVAPAAGFTKEYASLVDGSLHQRTEDGNDISLAPTWLSVYDEAVEVVTSPSGNNQMAALTPPTTVSLPFDTKRVMGYTLAASTDGSTAVVTVKRITHGLTSGDTTTVTTATAIGGISGANLSVTAATVTVLDANNFTYTALATSGSIASGNLDVVKAFTVRRYVVGSDELKVYRNGSLQYKGVDYNELGAVGSLSSTIQWLVPLAVTEFARYRIERY